MDEQETLWDYYNMEDSKKWEDFETDTMTLNYYQQQIVPLILNKDPTARFIEHSLGLAGETGEVTEKVKKLFRDGTFNKEDFSKELGDVLFYVAALADLLEIDLGKVAKENLDKLKDRQARGVLGGSGDNR